MIGLYNKEGGSKLRDPQLKIPYDFILNRFAQCNPHEISPKVKIPYICDENNFILKFMGDEIKINYPNGTTSYMNGALIPSYVLKTIFLRYLVNGTGKKPTGTFITYKEIQDGQIYYPNFYKRTIRCLAQIYQKTPEIFNEKYSVPVIVHEHGDFSFSFEFLPNVMFMFILYEGDDEFPAEANILMDSNIEDYFNAEDLAVVVDVAIAYFINKGKVSEDLRMY